MRFPTLLFRSTVCVVAIVLGTTSRADTPEPAIMARINTARQLVREGKLSEALDQFINPTIAEFQAKYGGSTRRVYCANGSVETLMYMVKAVSEKQDAIAVDAGYAQAYFMKGYILVEQHQVQQAFESLSKAVELSPNNPQFLCELANLFQSQHEWTKTMELYERAADSAPIFDGKGGTFYQRRALRGKAYVLVEIHKIDEAKKLYQRCLELDPKDRTATDELQYIADLRSKNAK
jgi:tetratricopeptide (TPR) repeat protein